MRMQCFGTTTSLPLASCLEQVVLEEKGTA